MSVLRDWEGTILKSLSRSNRLRQRSLAKYMHVQVGELGVFENHIKSLIASGKIKTEDGGDGKDVFLTVHFNKQHPRAAKKSSSHAYNISTTHTVHARNPQEALRKFLDRGGQSVGLTYTVKEA